MKKLGIISGVMLAGVSAGFGTPFPPTGKWTTFLNADDIYALSPAGVGATGIWVGTTGGALNGDAGRAFTKYTNAEGLPGNDVRAIAVSASGEVWFGLNGDGVSRYTPSGNIWRQYTTYDGLEDNRVISVLADGNILWFGMEGGSGKRGLVRFDDKGTPDDRQDDEWTPYDSLSGDTVQALALKGDTLWIATPSGLFRAIRTTGYPYLTQWQRHLWGQSVMGLAFEPGLVWASTAWSGVFRWDGVSWTMVNNGLPSLNVGGLALSGSQFWAATSNGMAQYDFGGSRWIVHNEGLTDTVMRCVALDASDRAWAGGYTTGIWFWNGVQWQKVLLNQIAYNWVDHLFVSPAGKVLVSQGPYPGIGISVFSQGVWDTLRIPLGRPTSNWVSGVLLDQDGSAWLCTWGAGLFHYGLDRTWTCYTKENTNNGLQGNIIPELTQDSSGNLFVGPWYEALCQLFPDRKTWASYYPGFQQLPYTALLVDRKGRVWAGIFDQGLLLYDHGIWTHYTVASNPPLPASTVLDLAEDDSSNVWLATSGGLAYFNGRSYIPPYTKSSTGGGLPSDQVTAVAKDSQGWVWAGTDAGLAAYDPQRKRWATFTQGARGLVQNKIRKLRIQPNPQDIHRDQIWIGTINGLSLFEPDNPPPADLREINVFPNPYRSGTGLVTFQGLPDGADIRIYTSSGDLVRHLSQPDPHRHSLTWDGRNESGRQVASGLFPYLVNGAGRARGGTLTILR